MKTNIFFLIGLSFLFFNSSIAQWQSDFRLTNNSAGSYTSLNNARSLAASNDTLHVIWYDSRDSNYEIYYKRSTDNGLTWDNDLRLTNNTAPSAYPSIAVSGLLLVVAWQDDRDGNSEIYFKRSVDGGLTWEEDTRLTNDVSFSYRPSVATNGLSVIVTWQEYRDGNAEIYTKLSLDGGASWGNDTRLTYNSDYSGYPSVSTSGSLFVIAWSDQRDGNKEIYFKRSADSGNSWSSDTRLTNDNSASGAPSVFCNGQSIHVAWQDFRDGNYEIYYNNSSDDGLTWGSDKRLTNNSASSLYPSVSANDSIIHVAWQDSRDFNDEIYYTRSTDFGLSWETETRLTNSNAISEQTTIEVSGSVVNIVWSDERDGNREIYYKRNPTGNIITNIQESETNILTKYYLDQNFPNPFNPATIIKWQSPLSGQQTLKIYDVLGNEIATLVDEYKSAGSYSVQFNADNLSGGVYFYRIISGGFTETKKMILLK